MKNNGFSHLVPLLRGCRSRQSPADPCLPEEPSQPMAARSSDRRPPRFGALPSPCLLPTVPPPKEAVGTGGGGGGGNSGDSRGLPREPYDGGGTLGFLCPSDCFADGGLRVGDDLPISPLPRNPVDILPVPSRPLVPPPSQGKLPPFPRPALSRGPLPKVS